ncbi:MAG: type II toxin-antitoxin system VapB family antitoxin [Nitrospirae bacterium]|nr:type II toxin-antitoxin system VapB family antitoxin [Nitrospirota bacterium]
MRTNIVIDERLFMEALKYSKSKTKKDLIKEALQKFIDDHKRMDLRRLRGKIHFKNDYDYKALRKGN